jgi:hypothetical protein
MAMAVPEAAAQAPGLPQAALLDFALVELVRQHRCSFMPLWSRESWAKLLIWLALNSGCATDRASLEAFALSLGPQRSESLRRVYFSREFEATALRLLADPAEGQVLVQGAGGGAVEAFREDAALEPVAAALEAVGLTALVIADRQRWQRRHGGVLIPFR